MVEIRFEVPRAWRDELKAAAEVQAITVSTLLRLIIRGFLRNRYTDEEQKVLGA